VEPTFELCEIQESIKQDKFYITEVATTTAASIGFMDEDIKECIVNDLKETHFYKTMPSMKITGLMQDVYKITYQGTRVYLKLQINKGGNAVVISFKEDESP
jgi:hypothetical protein